MRAARVTALLMAAAAGSAAATFGFLAMFSIGLGLVLACAFGIATLVLSPAPRRRTG